MTITDNKNQRILVVDDEMDMLETCRKILSLRSYQVDIAASAGEALQLFRTRPFDLVIVDLKMPETSGLELMKKLHKIRSDQLVVMITAYATVENALQAVQTGAFDFVRKPFKMDDLLVVVRRALGYKALQDENQLLQEKLNKSFRVDRIVGKSQALKQALVTLRKVSEVDVPVLVFGESGTGKELFARTIHENGARNKNPFVAIDCAALPEHLLESELFGYERGAFTGAVRGKAGLFELASGGTILLDEIGEMSLKLQVKLLRTLQEGRIRRLGENQERDVDVRILAATHRNLEDMISEGRFREDLYYRINVVKITVPCLRDREGDVRHLADYFFDQFCSTFGKKLDGISAAAFILLEEYDWPGNVRELRNAIERACTLTEAMQILPQDLPPTLLSAVEEKKALGGGGDFQDSKRAVVEKFERNYLIRMLERTDGNVTEASHFSGLSRPAFHRLMSKYGITSSDFRR